MLGITVNAVRQRVKRGTLLGVRTAAGWLVVAPQPTDRPRPTAAATATDQGAGVDLAPLVALIERQGEEIRRLTEAATVWQMRALHAEERLKQLTAGAMLVPASAGDEGAAPALSESADTEPAPRPWWKRLLGLA